MLDESDRHCKQKEKGLVKQFMSKKDLESLTLNILFEKLAQSLKLADVCECFFIRQFANGCLFSSWQSERMPFIEL